MTMYKLVQDFEGNCAAPFVRRIGDNAFIPFDPANTDYQQYLAWLAEGNEPSPPDEAE